MEYGSGGFWLEGGLPGEENQKLELSKVEPIILGRDKACQIQIKDARVSRQHAELSWRDDGFQLADLDTSNGTFVNGTEIQQASLKVGDRIEIGKAVFILHGPETETKSATGDAVRCRYCGRRVPPSLTECPGCGAVTP